MLFEENTERRWRFRVEMTQLTCEHEGTIFRAPNGGIKSAERKVRCVSTVLYRPFEDEDFEPLVEIVRTLWHNDDDVPDAAFGTLEATCDLAHCLSVSTFSQVALIDGAPRGIILARSENDYNQDLSRWATIEAKSACAMDSYDAKAAHTFQTWYDGMRKVDERLLASSGLTLDNEITLLVVDPSAQGLGIGTVLFDAASSYYAALGDLKAYLYTDSDCRWSFYELRGMKRLGRYKSTREERSLLPREMYLYGLDLSA